MSQVRFSTTALVPTTPPTDQIALYAKGDKKLYYKDDAGTETGPIGAGGGGGPTGPAGGDLGGTYPNPSVVALQGNPVLSGAPGADTFLGWNGAAWAATPLPPVGPDNVAYLAMTPRGNDATGTVGDASKPFASFDVALAALSAVGPGGVAALVMGPGDFGVNVPPTWPTGITRLSIIGAGRNVTRVYGLGAVIAPNPASPPTTTLVLKDFLLESSGTPVINADGLGSAGNFMSGGLYLKGMGFRCTVPGSFFMVSIKKAGIVFVEDCFDDSQLFGANSTWLFETSNVFISNLFGVSKLDISFDASDPDAPFGPVGVFRITSRVSDADFNQVTIGKQADVLFTETTKVGPINGSGLNSVTVGPTTYSPRVEFRGICQSNINFAGANAFPDAPGCRANFPGMKLTGNLSLEVAIAAANRLVSRCDGSVIGGVVTALGGVDIFLNTASIQPFGSFSTPTDGTITPNRLSLPYSLLAPVVEAIPFGFTANSPPVTVQVTPTAPPPAPMWIGPTTPSGITLNHGLLPGPLVFLDVRW